MNKWIIAFYCGLMLTGVQAADINKNPDETVTAKSDGKDSDKKKEDADKEATKARKAAEKAAAKKKKEEEKAAKDKTDAEKKKAEAKEPTPYRPFNNPLTGKPYWYK